jgi:hypothetical protein
MITLDFNQLARIAKVVALLGFFLPWVTVSCSSTDVLNATGWQLMTGEPELAGPFPGTEGAGDQEEREPAWFVVAAFVVVVIGLGLSALMRGQRAAVAILATAVLGMGLSYYSVQHMRGEFERAMSDAREENVAEGSPFFTADQQQQLSRTVAEQVRVEEQEGFWLTLLALLGAATFATMTLMSRRVAAPPDGS